MTKSHNLIALFAILCMSHLSFGQTVPFPPVQNNNDLTPYGYTDKGTNWDTSDFLPFIYHSFAMRLMPPNDVSYNAQDDTWSNAVPGKKYPIILFFHGRGEGGTDNNNTLKHGGKRHRDAVLSGEFPGFLLYPQDVTAPQMKDVLDKLVAEGLPIDLSRVYIHGLSRGAQRTWDYLYSYSNEVAAAWPMSGVGNGDYNDILYTPIRLAQGGKDKNPTPDAAYFHVDNITDLGGQIELFFLPNHGHGTWNSMYYRSDFFSWFLSQSVNKIEAKYSYSEVCPEDPIDVILGVNPGNEGYEWSMDDGNGEVVISGENGHELQVTEFGDYRVRVLMNGTWTSWSDALTVGERQPTQTPPIQLAELATYVLPDPNGGTTVELTLPDGYEQYEWFKDGSPVGTNQEVNAVTGEYTALVQELYGCSSNLSAPYQVIENTGINVPTIPFDLAVTSASKTEIDISWTESSNNETAFELYRRNLTSEPFELIALLPDNTTNFHDENLLPGTEYFYSLRAINENGASDLSVELSDFTETDIILPTVPLNLEILSTTSSSVTLQWEFSTDDVGVARYDIYQNGVKVLSTEDDFITIYNLLTNSIYRFNVVSVDLFGNNSPMSNRVVVSPVSSGLNFKYYEGSWSNLPDFDALTPVSQGNSDNIDLSYREQNDDFGFLWEGKINIPVAGDYTFETYSDDGSKLYIGPYDHSATALVNNDGLHGSQFRSGTYNFPNAGSYDIAMTFFERGGGERMEVYWSNTAHGVGSRQIIPSNAFSDEMSIPEEVVSEPSDFVASTMSTTEIDLSWTDQSTNEINYQLFRAIGSPVNFEPIALLAANSTSFSDSGLEPDTEYFYKLIALGQYGQSGNVVSVSSILEMPLDNSAIDISGNNVQSTTSGIVVYDQVVKIQGSHAVSFAGNASYISVDNGNQFIHSELTERAVAFWIYTEDNSGLQDVFDEGGATNGYGIRINNGNIELGVQDAHNIALISAPLATNQWVHVATNFNNGRIELYIDGVLSAENNNVGYSDISAHGDAGALGSTNGSNAFDAVNRNFGGWIDDFFIFDTALTQGDVDGLIGRIAQESIASAITQELPAPSDPIENFTTEVLSQRKVAMTWDVKDVIGYQVFRSANTPDDFELIAYLDETMNSYIDSTFDAHTDYYYTVRSRIDGGYSPIVDPVLVSIPNADPTLETEVSDYSLFYDDVVSLTLVVNDEDGDIVVFQESNFPSFASLQDNGNNSAILVIDPEAVDFGLYENLSLEINDGFGGVIASTFNLEVISNNAPEIEPVDNYSVSGGNQLVVTINASDINGDGLGWTVDNLPSFGTATPSQNGEELTIEFNPSISGEGGVYTIDLRVDDDNAISSKFAETQLVLTVIDFDPNHKVYVNFGFNSDGAAPWNNFTFGFPSANKSLNDLVNDQGFVTGASVTLETTWTGVGVSGGMGSGLYENNVRKTYIYTDQGSETFTVSGLDVTATYNFDFFASRNGSGDRTTTYQIGEESSSIQAAGNTNDIATINSVQPDENGTISITVIKPSGSSYAYINSMVMEAVSQNGIAPLKPTNLFVAVDTQIDLSWEDNAVNEDGYNVLRSTFSGGTFVNVGVLAADANSFIDSGLETNTTYFYKVEAFNSFGSKESDEFEVFIPNLAPTFTEAPGVSLEIEAGGSVLYDFVAVDSPGDVVVFTLENEPSFMVLNDNGDGTSTIITNPLDEDFGLYSGILIKASDGSLESTYSFELTVNPAGFVQYYVNVTSGASAASPWNNFITNGNAGTSITNLVSAEGEGSTVAVELVDAWGGNNNSGMPSGIFPQEVMGSSVYESSTAPNRISISGLDTEKVYKFGFFASRDGSGERITDYSIGSTTVFLNASYNSNDIVYINNVIPDLNGEVEIVTTKRSSSTYAYINALTIEGVKYVPGVIEDDPIVLSARGISDAEIGLNWVETIIGEDEIEVWRSTTSDEQSFTLLGTSTANSTSFVDASAAINQLYYYKVRTRSGTEYSDFSNTVNTSVILFTVSLNFNADDEFNAPSPWNNLNQPAPTPGDEESVVVFSDLMRSDGGNSGFSMTLPESHPNFPNFGFIGDNGSGMITGDNSGVVPDNVMRNSFWMDQGMTAEVIYGNMTSAYRYTFEFFASRNGSGNRTTTYTIDGITTSLDASYNTVNTATINNVIPDESSEVHILVGTTPTSLYGYLGALMVHAYLVDPDSPSTRSNSNTASTSTFVNEVGFNDVVYPNPFQDELKIEAFLREGTTVKSIRILDIQGRQSLVQTSFNNSSDLSIDTRGLTRGIYFLEVIKSDNSSKVYRVVKK